MTLTILRARRWLAATAVLMTGLQAAHAQRFVPGTGTPVENIGDDFEGEQWEFYPNGPKSSRDIDKKPRHPLGRTSNARWVEGIKRGYPDVVQRVPTPAGGLPGSKQAMMMQSLRTGVPGFYTGRQQQDDFILDSSQIPYIRMSMMPSAVVRVYLPPFHEWEDRTGTSFGFRAELHRVKKEEKGFLLFRRTEKKIEPYWPGIFIQFNSETDPKYDFDSAFFIIRCDEKGEDIVGPQIMETGWWTLGMSFSPDGQAHYYARPGVGELTEGDHIASTYPYSFKPLRFNTIFFNVVNRDDGRSWSTRWIIDDPAIYTLYGWNRRRHYHAYRR